MFRKINILSLCVVRTLSLVFFLLWQCNMVVGQPGGKTITGKVTDETNEPLIGVNVLVVSTSAGTVTDFNGNYSLSLPDGAEELQFSYIGYSSQTIRITGRVLNVQMKSDSQVLSDVVVIGYGTQRKSDLTGAVTSVSTDDFNTGLISSPEQLINGKVSGVQIMSNSGSPTAGSTIRVRGGASLNASNDPLIVLDGVPLEQGGISGNDDNFLSLINPNDIESMTILKDASSTAIYGSRASNGVIIITTKKGNSEKLKISFSTTHSIQTRTKMADMLSYDEFVNVVNTQGSAAQQALLGSANTDWNDQIYHTAYGTDNNLSLSGQIAPNWPLRVSVGYYNQDGLLKTDNAERWTGSVSLSPSFFDDHLKLTLNVKGSLNKNQFANTSAIWGGATMNPTLPVYSGSDAFGGYTEAIGSDGNPVTGAVLNPLGLLEQHDAHSKVTRVIGNFDIDYRVHFLPELKLHATLGYDYAKGKGSEYVNAEAAEYYTSGGYYYPYGPEKTVNRLLTIYANYNKFFDQINSSFDITGGYDYQYWKSFTPTTYAMNLDNEVQATYSASDYRHTLLSYYGRLNYSYGSRYMLTATVRRDATSRFSSDNRWGTFPSVAVGWRLTEEEFMKNQKVLSTLKLRASFGVTGQQDGIGNYNYLPVYTLSQDGAQSIVGGTPVYTYRPEAYVSDLKWETTHSWDFGFDFGFFNDRLTGSFDYYTRETKDLIATVPAAAGTAFDKTITTNVGNVDSHGIEVTLNATPIQTKDFTWDISFNVTWQKMKVKNLSIVEGGEVTNTSVGPTIDGYYFQTLTEGYEPYTFYVYKQLYDEETGMPIEGAYADLNNDGVVNSDDLYHYHSPSPDVIMGLSTSLRWKNWNLGMSFRSNIGNYVYNGTAMNSGAFETMSYNSYQLNNLSASYLKTNFQTRQYLSDYYVENASFLKMDNLSLSYNFGEICKGCSLNVSVMVQNVFCITKYSGVDPEVPDGMDYTFYPRPRTYSFSLGFNF